MRSGSFQEREDGQADVSVVVIALNEERNIEECLGSARWAREIIVVDAESCDRTVEIAGKFTDKVWVRRWPGFGPQKNFGIEQASCNWIFILDADERISPELANEIARNIESDVSSEALAFRVPRRNHYYGQWVLSGGVYPDYQIRLFKKGCARYNDVRLHENLIIDGKIGTLQGHLEHYTEREIRDHFRKFGAYTTLSAHEKVKTVRRVRWSDLVLRPLIITFKAYVLKNGFSDGIHGLILSVFAGMFTFVKYCKAWDLLRRKVEAGG